MILFNTKHFELYNYIIHDFLEIEIFGIDDEEVMNKRCEYLVLNKDTIEIAKKLRKKGYHIYVLLSYWCFTYIKILFK